jgi:hypothetical protein
MYRTGLITAFCVASCMSVALLSSIPRSAATGFVSAKQMTSNVIEVQWPGGISDPGPAPADPYARQEFCNRLREFVDRLGYQMQLTDPYSRAAAQAQYDHLRTRLRYDCGI